MRIIAPVLVIISLFSLIISIFGTTEFDWHITSTINYVIIFSILFIQSLTLLRLSLTRLLAVNYSIFLLQLVLLLFFKYGIIEIKDSYIWNLGLVLIGIQVFLLDIQQRYTTNSVLAKLIYLPIGITVLSFVLCVLNYDSFIWGFTSVFFSGILAILAIFSSVKKSDKPVV